MKTFLKVLTMVLAAILISMSPAFSNSRWKAATIENHSDSWAWVTYYNGDGDIQRPAFCVAPGQTKTQTWSRRGVKYREKLRFEMTTTNCAHPRYADIWREFGGAVGFTIRGSHKSGYKIDGFACRSDRECGWRPR